MKPIIGGPDTPKPQEPRASSGGVTTAKPLAERPPVGPKGINDPQSPGLHGTNHGNSVNQGRH